MLSELKDYKDGEREMVQTMEETNFRQREWPVCKAPRVAKAVTSQGTRRRPVRLERREGYGHEGGAGM